MSIFDRLLWQRDRILLDNLVFRLEDQKDDAWELGADCFAFAKTRRLVDQYQALWASRPDFHPRHIFELGMWDGGSIAFWFEHFQPDMIVGVDSTKRDDSDYFRRYIAQADRARRIKTYWNTNQANRQKLRQIVTEDLGGRLDLVIDDASHMFEETKASFETLFPYLRPGGLYIIEDWSWALWPGLPIEYMPMGAELPKLISMLTEATGSMTPYLRGQGSAMTLLPLIANTTVYPDFVVVERGPAEISGDLDLRQQITHSPQLQQVLKHPPDGKKPWWRFGM